MNAEIIIVAGITFFSMAPILIIGIVQYRSKNPVGFWAGKEPPKKDQISNVKAYNHRHGLMWILYGIGFSLCFMGGFLYGGELAAILGMIECVGGIFAMIAYHNRLDRKYCRKEGEK